MGLGRGSYSSAYWRVQCDRQKRRAEAPNYATTRVRRRPCVELDCQYYQRWLRRTNNTEIRVGLINLENRSSITELSGAAYVGERLRRLEDIAVCVAALAGNGNPMLVFQPSSALIAS